MTFAVLQEHLEDKHLSRFLEAEGSNESVAQADPSANSWKTENVIA